MLRKGWTIFSALPGKKFDMDFVLVGPAGVFVVEVKNPGKYAAEDTVFYQGGKLWLRSRTGGIARSLSRKDPIKQARRSADWLKRYLSDVMGRRIEEVRSLVLFPNFMVEEHIEPDLWVLNPKRFVSEYCQKAPQVYDAEESGRIETVLRAYIKTVDTLELAEA